MNLNNFDVWNGPWSCSWCCRTTKVSRIPPQARSGCHTATCTTSFSTTLSGRWDRWIWHWSQSLLECRCCCTLSGCLRWYSALSYLNRQLLNLYYYFFHNPLYEISNVKNIPKKQVLLAAGAIVVGAEDPVATDVGLWASDWDTNACKKIQTTSSERFQAEMKNVPIFTQIQKFIITEHL